MYWEAYAREQPIGPWAADYRAGVLCATLVNVHAKRKGYKPWHFFPWLRPKRETDPDQIEAYLAGLASVKL